MKLSRSVLAWSPHCCFVKRRMVRDVAIAAVILGLLALAPIMFWRLLSDKVIFYKAYNTFYVLCFAMLVVIAFEATFYFLRQFLVQRLTARLDVKLSTYVFEKVLNLPIDYFEQNAVGLISRDIREVFRIRTFLLGQLFGTVLDSTTLVFFLPLMFFFSPIMTFVVLGFSGIIVAWLLLMLPAYRKKSSAVIAAEGALGAFLIQTLNGIRTIKSLALDTRQRHGLGCARRTCGKGSTCREYDRKFNPGGGPAAGKARGQWIVCTWRLSGFVDQ